MNKSILILIGIIGFLLIGNIKLMALDRFVDKGENSVLDNKTGLIWQKKEIKKNVKTDEGVFVEIVDKQGWFTALKSCEDLEMDGKSDWRLPNVKELRSLVSHMTNSGIDKFSFPEADPSYYWTSTTNINQPLAAWVVYFGYGSVSFIHKELLNYVRCVRSEGN